MSVDTVQVNVRLNYPNGNPAIGIIIKADLQSPSQDENGYIVQNQVSTETDENGEASLNLWPNESGVLESYYQIIAYDTKLQELLNVYTIVPESNIPLDLDDIAMPVKTFSLENTSANVANIRQVNTDEGLTGGGDLTTNRTHKMDLSTISTEVINPPVDWVLPIQDPNSPDSINYVKLINLPGLGYDVIEESISTSGQTEIFITAPFSAETGQIDLFIDGKFVLPENFEEEIIVDETYFGKIILPYSLTSGKEIAVKIKKNASFASEIGVNASEVNYDGGGSVEDALDTLLSLTGAAAYQTMNSDFNAQSGAKYLLDASGGSFNITLPISPNPNDTITFFDISQPQGSLEDNPITILRNGQKIMGLDEDLTFDESNIDVDLVFVNSTKGWRISD